MDVFSTQEALWKRADALLWLYFTLDSCLISKYFAVSEYISPIYPEHTCLKTWLCVLIFVIVSAEAAGLSLYQIKCLCLLSKASVISAHAFSLSHCDLPLPGSLLSKGPPLPLSFPPLLSLSHRSMYYLLSEATGGGGKKGGHIRPQVCPPWMLPCLADRLLRHSCGIPCWDSLVHLYSFVPDGPRRSEQSLTSLFRHSPKCIQSSSQMNQSANSPKRVLRNLGMQIKAQINHVTRNYF